MKPGDKSGAGAVEPELRPPGSHPVSVSDSNSRHILIWGGMLLVVVLGLVVLLVLPKLVDEDLDDNKSGSSDQSLPQVEVITQSSGGNDQTSRERASQALQEFLQERARLELENAPVWGEPEWSIALDSAARGNDLFAQSQFSESAEALESSLALFRQIESERDQRLQDAITSGFQALLNNDSPSAIGFFEIALAIDSGHEDAGIGLMRANVRPEVLRLMEEADDALSMGELRKAQAAYAEAVALDERYEPAASALWEITRRITDIDFRDAMSRALSALQSERIEDAALALQQAEKLKSGEQVVKDARFQLAQVRQKLWLANQRQAATAKTQFEDWSGAAGIYRKVLAREPQANFARTGLELAEDRERLHRQLDHYLADPTRVWSAQPRSNAEKLIVAAGNPPDAEKKLNDKLQRLQKMIIEARTPLTVTLQSDGLTNVVIYHIGRLGVFTSHQLNLTPGTYTAVGSRPGYRDVRQTFTVKPGSDQIAVNIRCEETI